MQNDELKIIRVFPRKTKWSPTDELAFFGGPPLYELPDLPVYVSVTFTWDTKRGMRLFRAWSDRCRQVRLGGPAYDDPGDEFEPGRFLKPGVTITSRGCPKKCSWCKVPKREGKIRELQIKDGWIVQDNNLLACSDEHIVKVFEMLHRQPIPVSFPGGLDLDYLQDWHVDCLKGLQVIHKFAALWVAFDSDEAMLKLPKAKDMLAGFSIERKFAYVLIGFKGDTLLEAEDRCQRIYDGGFLPFAMLHDQRYEPEWEQLQRRWCRPAIYRSKINCG